MAARVAWIVAWAQLAATVAHADPAEQAALAHLDRGVAAFRAGDFTQAHAELAEAQRLAPDRPNPYRWLAMTEVELGDCRGALVDVESFLSRVPAGDPRVPEIIALRGRCVAPGTPRVEPTPETNAIRAPIGSRGDPAIYRRWWFWAAVGAVAITAGGVTYAVTRDGGARLPAVTCDPAGCRP